MVQVLRLPDVLKRTGLSRSSIYLKMSQEAFPQSIPLGERSVGWLETEIDEWIAVRIKASRIPTNKEERTGYDY